MRSICCVKSAKILNELNLRSSDSKLKIVTILEGVLPAGQVRRDAADDIESHPAIPLS